MLNQLEPYDIEFRIIRPDGEERIAHTRCEVKRDSAGNPIAIRGPSHDIAERKRSEEALAQAATPFRTVLEASADGIIVADVATTKFTLASGAICQMLGYEAKELMEMGVADIQPLASLPKARAPFNSLARGNTQMASATPVRRKDGSVFLADISVSLTTDRTHLVGIFRDVTERKRAEEALRDSEQRFRTIFAAVNDVIIVHELNTGAFLDFNPRLCEMFGYTRDELLRLDLGALSAGAPPYTINDALPLLKRATAGEAPTFEWQCKTKNGRLFWIEVSVRRASFGGRDVLVSVARNITPHTRAEEQIAHLARHDVLTGLANRAVFVEMLDQAIARVRRGGKAFAILYLDLDHFKDVNDTLGHPVGDLLLQGVAERLRAAVRESDTVARFGGDEFAIIETDIGEPGDAAVLAHKILEVVAQPFSCLGNDLRTGASIGIAAYRPDSPDAEIMLSHADVALYRAKNEGRGTYRFFTESMNDEVRARYRLGAELRDAIATGQLFLAYQPQVEAPTGRIVGVEALARWRHPRRGVVSPKEFIPVAEKSGLIIALGQWALREACRQMKEWVDRGIAPPLVAVNISALQFKTPTGLERDIDDALKETGLSPARLELELTESVLMEASREHNDVLQRLGKAGVRLAIDDFGTGYSSLDYLLRFPVDRIKVAQNFVVDLTATSGNAAIIKAAISLARELNLEAVVEGVETEEQLNLIVSWGCRHAQGYFFSKPLTPWELRPLLEAGAITAQAAAAKAP